MANERIEVDFPGVYAIFEARLNLGLGVTPSVQHLSINPQPGNIAQIGDLMIGYQFNRVVLRDCLADSASFQRSASSGLIIGVSLLDRRWKWKFRTISGYYNRRDSNGKIIGGEADWPSERTPQELATLLLEELGESEFDITALPNDTRPLVEWNYASAALELGSLCDKLNCGVSLTLDNRIVIVRKGEGREVPEYLPISRQQATLDPVDLPDEITVVTSAYRIQMDFELEAVGRDIDGSIKPIDELSYKPADGWNVWGIQDGYAREVSQRIHRSLAAAYVYRWFRIVMPTKPLQIEGGTFPISHLDQILPLYDTQAATYLDIQNNIDRPLPAVAYGLLYREAAENGPNSTKHDNTDTLVPQYKKLADGDTTADNTVPGGVTLVQNGELGIVSFGQPVFALDTANKKIKAPELWLRCTVPYRNEDTREFGRHRLERTVGDQRNVGAQVAVREELVPWVKCHPEEVAGSTNLDEIDKQAELILDEIQNGLSPTGGTPGDLTIAAIWPESPDGANQVMSWTLSQAGHTTQVQRFQDRGTAYTMGYEERRRVERDRQAILASQRYSSPSALLTAIEGGRAQL